LISSLLMAVNSSYISRTSMGFFDDETVGIFSLVLLSLFFLRAVEAEKPLHESIFYAVGAGLMAGYLNASWGAARYALGLVSLFVLIALIARFYNRRYLISYSITIGISYFIGVFVPRLGLSDLQSIDSVAIIGFFVLLMCFEIIRGRVGFKRLIIFGGASLAVFIIALLVLEYAGLIYPIAMKFIAVIFPGSRAASPIIESVAEHKRASWGIYFNDFGFSIALALLGLYFAVRKPSDKKLYGLVFFLSGLYFSGSFVRLFLILSVPLVIMAAYGVKELLSPFMVIASQKSADRLVRRRRVFGLGRGSGILFIIIILAALLPSVWSAADNLKTPSTMAATIPVLIGGNYPQDWLQALNWMKDNLPEDAVVVSWWDYGYWIQTLSGKRTLADGATINTTQIAQIGKIMMLGENTSLKILKSFNATHIVVYTTFNPNNPSQELPFGDNAKWYWMVKIAGLNETEYINNNQYTDKYYESTLYKLMKNLANQTYFKPVYESSNGWVIVYEIRYPSDEGL
ncbi:MAG: STT3 domain-containing protein, partial [Candidatus Bathyarchaeia archaeon]